jgi:hypothetical protein
MILGIASIPLACCCLGLVAGIAAVVLGQQSSKEIAASGGAQSGAGQAKAGVICGWVGIALSGLIIALNIIGLIIGDGTFDYTFETGS